MEGEVLTVRLEQQPEGAAPGALVFPAKFGARTGEVEMHGEPPGGVAQGPTPPGRARPGGQGDKSQTRVEFCERDQLFL